MSPQPKPPSASVTQMTEYVLPTHANAMGNVFGGQILAWMDLCAAMCAERHCGTIAVTAGIDELAFEHPVKIGQFVRLEGRVTAAFKSSVEIEVRVTGEDGATGVTWPCVKAYLTFVAIGPVGVPCPVPPLRSEGPDDEARRAAAEERRTRRLRARAESR